MENDPIKVPTARVPDKVLHRFGGLVGEQPEVDVSKSGVHHRRFRHARCERFRGCGRGNRLFFACGLFVEDVPVAGFVSGCGG
jgi:hypothetical protein